ncbi:MarR family winged helix-turn-helix transcriptional regulator [Streptomyces triculaminicus]|uniref:MarR family winged helix-turn-helix transcriptional regulator n=1 Tax=Streptomyces triculaminicus TaxID=2816232 RepID=UPI0037CD89E3
MSESTQNPSNISLSAARAAQDLRGLVSRLRRRFQEASGSGELTPSQVAVLSRLRDGEASASDIAAVERVRPQAIAATVAVLGERGLVERRPDPDDRRRQLVSLSPAGRDYVAGRSHAAQEWLSAELEENFTEQERQTVLTALGLLERLVRP